MTFIIKITSKLVERYG